MTNEWVKPGAGEKIGDRVEFALQSAQPPMRGTMFYPAKNESYDVTVNVQGEKMSTRGCVLGGIVCKSVGWTRLR